MIQPTCKQAVLTLATLFIFLLLYETSFAHRIRVFAYSSGSNIMVEGSFGKNRPAINSQISILLDSTGEQVLEGLTNDQGTFQFPKPQLAAGESLRVVLSGGQGHQAQWILTPEDMGEKNQQAQAPAAPLTHKKQTPEPGAVQQSGPQPEQLQQLIEQAVAKEIAPLKKMLIQQMDGGPSLNEIIGGIGWIVGLAGLISILKRKKTAPKEKP